MKGKAALQAAKRREQEARDRVVDILDELGEAKREVVRLRRQVVDQDGLRSEVERLRAQVEDNVSDYLTKVLVEREALMAKNRELMDYVASVRRHYENAIARALVALGGGTAAMEALAEVLGNHPSGVVIVQNEHTKGMHPRLAKALERKRDPNPGSRRKVEAGLAKAREMVK